MIKINVIVIGLAVKIYRNVSTWERTLFQFEGICDFFSQTGHAEQGYLTKFYKITSGNIGSMQKRPGRQ